MMWIVFVAIISVYTGEILSACNNCKSGYCNSDGKCNNCNDGYYVHLTTGLCNNCPGNCETCTNLDVCHKCKVGYYGDNCWGSCEQGCKKRSCYKADGRCKEGCIKGHRGGYCRSKCSEGCSNQTCIQDDGRCSDGCIKGYYGKYCVKCSKGCSNQTCNVDNGGCTDGCIDGQYGPKCSKSCLKKCATCSIHYSCLTCKVGYYGTDCRLPCPKGCKDRDCRNTDGLCRHGCLKGYYNSTCKKCSEGCVSQKCDESDGRCTDGCIDGYYGEKCFSCHERCATCITRYPCTSCKTGFFDKSCNKACINCRNNTCSFETGTCDNGCLDDYYYKDGIGCQACSDNCSKCTFGSVCDQCKPGFYVSNDGHANKNGSCLSCQNCKDPTTCFSKNVCPYCLDGSWGQYCQLSCSKNCLQVLNTSFDCWQHNFTCKEGCIEGFSGADCTEEIADSSSLLMIVGSSIGAVAVAVAIVLAVIILIRRHRSNTRIKSHGGDLSVKRHLRTDTFNRAYEDMTIYPTLVSNAGHHPTEATGDNVYANVQKPSRDPELNESGREGSDGDHVYDVTWNPAASVKQADQSLSPAEEDTYSHINHAPYNKEHRHGDEETYDHIVRENPHKGDIDDTYDVTGGQTSSKHAPTDEYSTVR